MTRTIVFMLFTIITVSTFSCRKTSFNTDSNFELGFSRDTVLFDTVFTELGSATQVFKVFNTDKNNAIEIDEIWLEEGENSKFRVNTDGEPGISFENITIAPEDSAYVFVEVTIDSNDESLPFVVEEKLFFNANGTEQGVSLIAWGQNAYFHNGGRIIVDDDGVNFEGSSLPCDEVWNNDKPHVLFGTSLVNAGCKLTINEGTQVYAHAGAGILVLDGTLEVNGTLGNEVVFQGDRLESSFQNQPGQWGNEILALADIGFGEELLTFTRGGIWLIDAEPSYMNYAVVKNGNIGIQVDADNAVMVTENVFDFRNCIVHNHSVYGVLGQGSNMIGFNNLFANCGLSVAVFQFGGEYRFDHSSFVNYWSGGTRQAPAFVLNNHYESGDNLIVRSLNESRFRNCVFYGDNAGLSEYSEFIVDIESPENEDYLFENCVLDTEQDVSDLTKFLNISNNVTPQFISTSDFDFRPTQTSNLREAALPIGGALGIDLAGTSRIDTSLPDIGCLEYTP